MCWSSLKDTCQRWSFSTWSRNSRNCSVERSTCTHQVSSVAIFGKRSDRGQKLFMPIPDEIRLRHMLDAARKAAELVRGKSRTILDQDEVVALALVRLVEIIGEAAT